MNRKKLLFVTSIFLLLNSYAQRTITFPSLDGLTLTADLYIDNKANPYMILFHQEGSSRGEYRETATKMMKFGYNCLAVDLRSGKESHYISNESSSAAMNSKKKADYASCLQDVNAAINYIYRMDTSKKVVIIGSSFSASLCLIAAKSNPMVKAVVAFSPGEYFGSAISLKDSLKGINKPALITGSTDEGAYWKDLFSKADQSELTFFIPEKKKGMHGSMALSAECDAQIDYWIEFMMFVKKIK